ncbi:hypothetical protein AAVH_27176 [Aphelenchoides avenae]|nr:hypothetical protein AAVH_27176 [Aphelenchus avenae]
MSFGYNTFESEQAREMQRMKNELRAKSYLEEDLLAQVKLRSAELQECCSIINQLNDEHKPIQNLQIKRHEGPINEARVKHLRATLANTTQELDLAEREVIELKARVEDLTIESFMGKEAKERLDAAEQFIHQLHANNYLSTSHVSTLMDIIVGPRGDGFEEFLHILPQGSEAKHQ